MRCSKEKGAPGCWLWPAVVTGPYPVLTAAIWPIAIASVPMPLALSIPLSTSAVPVA
jgi:hypothetical protein